ncbi:MAG: dCTP deaminase [Candidatus Hydrogenedentes bacterium]|nr:dCTP deaminase [Candidatus Hydrogenedentota bacterium]
MVLSSAEIQKALEDGRLVINPVPGSAGTKSPYNTHSVDLTLGSEIVIPQPMTASIDLSESGSIATLISQNAQRRTATKDQPYKLERGKFILAQTKEVISLPITSALGARIEGKSSVARCGVLVHFTAPTVHPGFHGRLTLEMINLGPNVFSLSPDLPIAQLIIEEVKGELTPNDSQFQNQMKPEGLKA